MEFNQDQLIKLIAQNLDLPEDKVKPESAFKEDLGADSLDLVEMAMALEEKYHIDIPDEDMEKFTRVQDAIDYLK